MAFQKEKTRLKVDFLAAKLDKALK